AANKAAEAERLYFEEFKKKDQALDAARAQFDADRIHIRSERDELLKLGKGTREFNERAQQLIDRLREHYQKMEADLEPYRDYPDVRAFLDDINHRQARLKGFEISLINPVDEVATTPGDGGTTPGDTSTVPPVVVPPADPKDPTAIDEKRGEAWVLSGAPVVKIETATRGVVVSSGPTGASWEITGDDGTKGIAGIKIDKAPPPVLYRGEEQTYLLSAFGQAPAAAVGIWKPTNFGGLPFDDNTAVAASFPGFRGGADFTIGRWHAHFIAVDDPEHSAPVTIVAELFRPLPNAERDPYVTITWTYVKSGAKNAPATP
ncbi:MAG TPA: hypothetical protein PK402_07265, partial [Tepidisphaeraceae bacterium]|nr:hypothetical protein [Tepidisphaeraceae bacterium]